MPKVSERRTAQRIYRESGEHPIRSYNFQLADAKEFAKEFAKQFVSGESTERFFVWFFSDER